MDGNHDDDGLALSMQQSTSNNHNNNTPVSMKRSNMDTSPQNNSSNNTNDEFNCKTFHKLMWNDNTTTLNDKERWLYECISTPSLSTNNNSNSSSEESCGKPSAAAAMSTEKIMAESNKEEQDSDLTPLQIFTNSTISINPTTISTTKSSTATSSTTKQPIWGLTQKHGGPCGVLASIQAEVIRILLFGRGDSGNGELYYPFIPKSTENYLNCVSAPICDYEGTSVMCCCV